MIKSDLPLARVRQRLETQTRVQIDDFLETGAADLLAAALANDVRYALALRDAEGARTLSADALAALGADAEAHLVDAVSRCAKDQYAFCFDSYMMVSAYRDRRDPGLVLHRVLEFFNSPDYLEFSRVLTGDRSIRRIDAQATRYRPGHFLNYHDDSDHDAEGRRYAYVVNLTRDWFADWGGLLTFVDAAGRVVETFVPRFNTLSLFRVPQGHFVSPVAPWARGPRLSITGWMMRG